MIPSVVSCLRDRANDDATTPSEAFDLSSLGVQVMQRVNQIRASKRPKTG